MTRLPGTPDDRAKIANINLKSGVDEQVSDWFVAGLETSNLEIQTVDQAGNSISRNTGQYSHYNIEVLNPYNLLLWDEYKWTEKDPAKWKIP